MTAALRKMRGMRGMRGHQQAYKGLPEMVEYINGQPVVFKRAEVNRAEVKEEESFEEESDEEEGVACVEEKKKVFRISQPKETFVFSVIPLLFRHNNRNDSTLHKERIQQNQHSYPPIYSHPTLISRPDLLGKRTFLRRVTEIEIFAFHEHTKD